MRVVVTPDGCSGGGSGGGGGGGCCFEDVDPPEDGHDLESVGMKKNSASCKKLQRETKGSPSQMR